jgi:S1-C subfamily serine protease
MNKIIIFLSIITVLVYFLIMKTPTSRLGSGFLINTGAHVFTYYNLVKEAKTIKVMFPNEDDIKANIIYKDIINNYAILKLKKIPTIKMQPFIFSNNDLHQEGEAVYTIGYPWTNTMEDKHTLINGKTTLNSKDNLININMEIDPVNSGSPLLNSRNELVGMVLYKNTENKNTPLKRSHIKLFIPLSILIDGIKILKTPELSYTKANHYAKTSQTISKNNVVLIEAF